MNQTETTTPDWLEKLQQESWQAEILISGGSLVGVLGLINNVDGLLAILRYGTKLEEGNIGVLIIMFWFPLIFLASGFLVHLLLRGFWIALIGANYVYPHGINLERQAMKGKFSNLIKGASNVPYLIKLDKLCGIVFALTFFVIFAFIGFLLFITAAQLIESIPTSGLPPFFDGLKEIVGLALAVFGLLGMVDFLTMGWLKRVKWFSWVYYPIHFIVSAFTLSALYRRLYYTVISNMNRWYILVALVTQVTLAFLIIQGGSRLPSDIAPVGNTSENDFLEVKENVVTGNALQFSIMHLPRMEDKMFKEWKEKNPGRTEKNFKALPPRDKMRLISGAYEVLLDTTVVDSLSWMIERKDFFTFHASKLTTLVDVTRLSRGSHQLNIRVRKFENEKEAARKAAKIVTLAPFEGRAYFYVNR